MMARVSWDRGRIAHAAFQFVRHDRHNRTVLCALGDEGAAFDEIAQHSTGRGARLTAHGDEVALDLRT
jgi:hypothetical protein